MEMDFKKKAIAALRKEFECTLEQMTNHIEIDDTQKEFFKLKKAISSARKKMQVITYVPDIRTISIDGVKRKIDVKNGQLYLC